MGRSLKLILFAISMVLLLSACAGPRYILRTGAENMVDAPVWPESKRETPRYRFAGVYYGEQNLEIVKDDKVRNGFMKALYWLAGVYGDNSLRQLHAPQGIVVDENGVLYVTDVGVSSLFVFDNTLAENSGGHLPIWDRGAGSHESFVSPVGVALGPQQQLLVTDSELGRVYRLDRDGNNLGSFGDGILLRPTGIARDSLRKEIYVSDTEAHDIKVFDDKGLLIRIVGSRGKEDGALNYPVHLCFAHDKLYVVDSMNARIQVFDPYGDHLLSFGSRGKQIGKFSRPKGVSVDSEGNIYVVDSYFDHLLVFNPAGEFLMAIGGTGDAIGSFYSPAGIWVDNRDQIYIADMANSRVVVLQFLGGD